MAMGVRAEKAVLQGNPVTGVPAETAILAPQTVESVATAEMRVLLVSVGRVGLSVSVVWAAWPVMAARRARQ
jgi:hypothetical protein